MCLLDKVQIFHETIDFLFTKFFECIVLAIFYTILFVIVSLQCYFTGLILLFGHDLGPMIGVSIITWVIYSFCIRYQVKKRIKSILEILDDEVGYFMNNLSDKDLGFYTILFILVIFVVVGGFHYFWYFCLGFAIIFGIFVTIVVCEYLCCPPIHNEPIWTHAPHNVQHMRP